MSAAALTLGERIANELLSGRVKQVYVEGDGTGYVFLTAIGNEAILVTLANANAKLALVFGHGPHRRRGQDDLARRYPGRNSGGCLALSAPLEAPNPWAALEARATPVGGVFMV